MLQTNYNKVVIYSKNRRQTWINNFEKSYLLKMKTLFIINLHNLQSALFINLWSNYIIFSL